MNKLICYFKFNGYQCVTEINRVSDVTNGFWINEDLKFDHTGNCKYWIPPHGVEYVKKEPIQ